jgi:hypothetical protein
MYSVALWPESLSPVEGWYTTSSVELVGNLTACASAFLKRTTAKQLSASKQSRRCLPPACQPAARNLSAAIPIHLPQFDAQ